MDIRSIGCEGVDSLAQAMDQQLARGVNMVMNLRVP
jgi:hypothetical protein